MYTRDTIIGYQLSLALIKVKDKNYLFKAIQRVIMITQAGIFFGIPIVQIIIIYK